MKKARIATFLLGWESFPGINSIDLDYISSIFTILGGKAKIEVSRSLATVSTIPGYNGMLQSKACGFPFCLILLLLLLPFLNTPLVLFFGKAASLLRDSCLLLILSPMEMDWFSTSYLWLEALNERCNDPKAQHYSTCPCRQELQQSPVWSPTSQSTK